MNTNTNSSWMAIITHSDGEYADDSNAEAIAAEWGITIDEHDDGFRLVSLPFPTGSNPEITLIGDNGSVHIAGA